MTPDRSDRPSSGRAPCCRGRAARWLVAVLLLLLSPSASAGPDEAGELAAAETAGAQLLFDYDFDLAEAHYAELSERFPDHPTGPYHLATVIWSRLAQESSGMRGSSLRNDRYFARSDRPEAPPEETGAFEAHILESYRRAERMLSRDPDDPEGLYYRGAAEALESGWAIVVERAWFRAARTIRRAVARLRQLQGVDPGFHDAYAVPGAYDYGIATLPSPLRMLAFAIGIRGDRDGGLEGVRITAEDGRRARWGALWTWAMLMQREERFDEAIEAVRELRRQFPKNPDFVLEEVAVLTAMGDFVSARELAERFLERRAAGHGNYHLAASGLPEARLGEALLFEERWDDAQAVLTRGLEAEPDDVIAAMLRFRRANARDGAGERAAALSDYLRVVQSDADPVLAEWAEALRDLPWPEGAPRGALPASPAPE